MILIMLACAGSPGSESAGVVPLSSTRLARRISLDLRGELPSAEELDRVEADPDAVWQLRGHLVR